MMMTISKKHWIIK